MGHFPQHSFSSHCITLQCVQTKLCLDKKYFNVKVFYDMEKFVRKKLNNTTPGFLKIILSTFFIINSEGAKTAEWRTGHFPQHSFSSPSSTLQCVQTKPSLEKIFQSYSFL